MPFFGRDRKKKKTESQRMSDFAGSHLEGAELEAEYNRLLERKKEREEREKREKEEREQARKREEERREKERREKERRERERSQKDSNPWLFVDMINSKKDKNDGGGGFGW